jgi:hypothetical protein
MYTPQNIVLTDIALDGGNGSLYQLCPGGSCGNITCSCTCQYTHGYGDLNTANQNAGPSSSLYSYYVSMNVIGDAAVGGSIVAVGLWMMSAI